MHGRPLHFDAILSFFLFFERLTRRSPHGTLPNFATCSEVSQIWNTRQKLGISSAKTWNPKLPIFRWFCYDIATWTRISSDWNEVLTNGKKILYLRGVPYMCLPNLVQSTYGRVSVAHFTRPCIFVMLARSHGGHQTEFKSHFAVWSEVRASCTKTWRYKLPINSQQTNENK